MAMRQAFNKYAEEYIGDIMEEEGFVPYKTTEFIRLMEANRLLQSISFTSGKHGGYKYLEIGYLPLFMFFRKGMGCAVAGRMHDNAPNGWSHLRWNFPKDDKETAERSMLGIRDVLLKYSIPYLNKYSTFADISQMLEEDNPDVVPPLYTALRTSKTEYKSYFALGAGDYLKAEKYLKKYHSMFGPNYVTDKISKGHKDEIEKLIEAVNNIEEIEKLMEKNRQNTIEILNLRKYINID